MFYDRVVIGDRPIIKFCTVCFLQLSFPFIFSIRKGTYDIFLLFLLFILLFNYNDTNEILSFIYIYIYMYHFYSIYTSYSIMLVQSISNRACIAKIQRVKLEKRGNCAPITSLKPVFFFFLFAHEQQLIRLDVLLFILQIIFFYYNNQVLNKKMLEDGQLLKKE